MRCVAQALGLPKYCEGAIPEEHIRDTTLRFIFGIFRMFEATPWPPTAETPATSLRATTNLLRPTGLSSNSSCPFG